MFLVINGKGLSTAQVANLRQYQVDMFLVIWNSTSCKLAPASGVWKGMFLDINGKGLSTAQVANLRQHQVDLFLVIWNSTSCKLAPSSGLFLVINGMPKVANLRQHWN